MLALAPMTLRELTRADWAQMLSLNLASVQELSELDERRLEWILSFAYRSLGVEHERELVAFALAIAPGTPYDSENYRWFEARFERFVYLDRVVVSERLRRRGIATLVYDAMEDAAAALRRIVCEVNLVPPNPASLAFHASRGYVEVGRLTLGEGKRVSLLSKELTPSA